MSLQEHLQQNSNEVWEPLKFNSNYMVSNMGRVKSLDRDIPYTQKNQYGETKSVKRLKGKILAPRATKVGYLRVQICNKDHYIHRLVAEAFIGNIEGLEINHIDGDKKNNNLYNLEIVTRFQNHDHAVLSGLNSTYGITRPILVDGVYYNSMSEASKTLGVSYDALKSRLDNPEFKGYKYNFDVRSTKF